jgi:hypothetical protein
MRRQMYVPEERPDYESYIADPENQRKAEEAAMNLITLGMGPMGEIPAGLRLARNILGGYRNIDRFLPRQDRGNAMLPEEMLQVEGPPARAALPKPAQKMSEDELRAMEIARMVGEGGPSASKQEAARREVRRRPSEEEMRANEVSRMESEGGMDPELAALLRSIKEDRERAAHAEDLARFEGEGGGAWTYTGPRYKYGLPATQGPREVVPFNAGAREMIPYGSSSSVPTFAGGAGNMDLLTPSYRFAESQRALPPGGSVGARPVEAAEGPSIADILSGNFPGAPKFADRPMFESEAPRPAGGPAMGGAPGDSIPPSSGGFTGPQNKASYGGETANVGLGDRPGSVGALTRSMVPFEMAMTEEVNKLKARRQGVNASAPVYDLEHSTPQPFDTWGRKILGPSASTSEMEGPYPTIAATGKGRSSGTPAPAPAAPQSTGADIKALWAKYNESGNAADFVRADKAMQEARKSGVDLGLPTAQGEKRGGSVEKKPDAVHKALEIIHHLVMR